jgi:signal transduction histidine kinase
MNAARGHLLVVDDNNLNREMLTRRLERRKYAVTSVENGERALAVIEKDNIDMVLLDVMMPGMSGIEVLEVIRKRFSTAEMPVIMTTAKTQSEDIIDALKHGANDYVTKPIDFNVLMARVETHLNLKSLFKLKDDFLSIASHDLKNPLFVVVCQAYLIANKVPVGTPMTEEAFDMVHKIAQHARTMQSIIADFLDFQAVEDGHIRIEHKPFDIRALALRVVESQSVYAAEKKINISYQPDIENPEITGDAGRLEQVMQNLIGNAIKFNPQNGNVLVRVRGVEDKVSFEVSDEGPGLTQDDLGKAFKQYGRLSNTPTGSEKSNGLGLAICKKLIDLHGGEIGVHNNPDRGACFWFRVRRSNDEE